MTSLFTKDVRGDVRVWHIEPETTGYTLSWGQLGGALQYKTIQVKLNKSGRGYVEQIALEIASKINKQLDKGYTTQIEGAIQDRCNAINLPRPMLALSLDKVKNINYKNAFVQRKYDGNRCLIANVEGELIAYTRNGKRIKTIAHILADIDIAKNTILDGELYVHNESLQSIVSWTRKKQVDTLRLKYNVYDLLSLKSFTHRLAELKQGSYGRSINIVETLPISSKEEAMHYFAQFREENYEGAILRLDNVGYEEGKRSKSLIKLKQWLDAEFVVLDITRSPDNWGILHMQTSAGVDFKATAPGTHVEKILVAECPHSYIGKLITIEYAYLTADGTPFHPIAREWRL